MEGIKTLPVLSLSESTEERLQEMSGQKKLRRIQEYIDNDHTKYDEDQELYLGEASIIAGLPVYEAFSMAFHYGRAKEMEKKNTEESLIMDEGLYDEYIDSDTPRASVELHKYYDELHDAFDRYLNEVQRVEFQAACRFGYEKAICKG